MVADTGHGNTSEPQKAVRAATLGQVEPDRADEFFYRPYSLTAAELEGLTATVASEPTQVLAWVRYPASADHVRAFALAWTPRAVYVEWEDEGTHRAWVWASAVQRTSTDREAVAPKRQRAATTTATTTSSTLPLVHLVNSQLALIGTEFVSTMTKPTGPFSTVVFGTVEGLHVRLDLSTDPATGMSAVLLVSRKEPLTDRSAAPTFEEAIDAYPWAAAIDALTLADEPGS